MYEKLVRKYKSLSAEETISRIKEILGELELELEPINQMNPFEGICSHDMFLKGVGITSCGKGMNQEYSQASGFAEFMERVQLDTVGLLSANRFDLFDKFQEKFGYKFYPDEKDITSNEFDGIVSKIVSDNFIHDEKAKNNYLTASMFYKGRILSDDSSASIALPFYDTKNQKEIYLPKDFLFNLTGSTGFCAGNTTEEAIVQGLFEIIERYAARKIYFERLTPPTVPMEYLEQFPMQLEIIRKIEAEEGVEIIVKDFSCGIGLPAIGVLAINHEAGTYFVQAGGETSFEVGLHRCLTEMYQNRVNLKDVVNFKIPEDEYEYFFKDDDDSIYLRTKNFIDWINNGTGNFTHSILYGTPSYEFNPNCFTSKKNYKIELNDLVKRIWDLGKNVYIRDGSIFGFNSYVVYIPDFSHDSESIYDSIVYYNKQTHTQIGSILQNNDPTELSLLIDNLQFQRKNQSLLLNFYYGLKIVDFTALFLLDSTNTYLLAFLKFYREDYEGCIKSLLVLKEYVVNNIDTLISKTNKISLNGAPTNKVVMYVDILIEITQKIKNGLDIEEIEKTLILDFDKNLVTLAISLLKDREMLIEKLNVFPKCPNCSECKINSYCGTKNSPEIIERLYSKMKTPNQMKLKESFEMEKVLSSSVK